MIRVSHISHSYIYFFVRMIQDSKDCLRLEDKRRRARALGRLPYPARFAAGSSVLEASRSTSLNATDDGRRRMIRQICEEISPDKHQPPIKKVHRQCTRWVRTERSVYLWIPPNLSFCNSRVLPCVCVHCILFVRINLSVLCKIDFFTFYYNTSLTLFRTNTFTRICRSAKRNIAHSDASCYA